MPCLKIELMYKLTIISLIIFSSTNLLFSQTNNNILKTIEITKKSSVEKINIEILEETISFSFSISCNARAGIVKIEIYNPKGEKVDNITIKNLVKKKRLIENINGQLNKKIKYPDKGIWVIKITPNNSVANVAISCNLKNESK